MQSDAPAEQLIVPPGFQVKYCRVIPTGSVYETGGLRIGAFGYVGDDFARLEKTFDAMHDTATGTCSVIDNPGLLSECFEQWDTLDTHEHKGAIVWTAFGDGLSWVLCDDAKRERLLAGFRSFAGYSQTLVLEAAPPVELRPLLSAAGVSLAFSSQQHRFAVEVHGPDGRVLHALAAGMPQSMLPTDAATLQSRPMLWAPGLTDTLDHAAVGGDFRAVFDALLAHPAALLARSNEQGHMPVMVFPHSEQSFLPIYPDAVSCQRAIKEVDGPNAEMAMAVFAPRKLFELSRDHEGGVAIGWYGGEKNSIRYCPIKKRDLEILCDGALPRQYSFTDHLRMFCGMRPRGARTG